MGEEPAELGATTADHIAAAVRATIGAIPMAGPLIAEVVTAVIPRQRLARLVEFAKVLDEKLSKMGRELIEQKAQTAEFSDLLEDALRQASRALSPERLQYIASLLKNSIEPSALSHIEQKRIMELLGELNDVEVIILASEANFYPAAHPFRERHKVALTNPSFTSKVPSEGRLRGPVYDSYRQRLRRLGLLEQRYAVDTPMPFTRDARKARVVDRGDSITPLGRIVLAGIDAEENIDESSTDLEASESE